LMIRRICLIVPCFDEVESLPEFYRRVCVLAEGFPERSWEFLFVNDGSADGSAEFLDTVAAQDQRVKVLHLACNRGHQIALMAGIDFAEADLLVTIDADLQDPPELVLDMVAQVERGFDVVHAQRRRRSGETLFKLGTARLFYLLMKCLGGADIIPDCGDFRAFVPAVQQTVRSFRTPHVFLRGLFAQAGYRQCVISYDRDPRFAGRTKYPFLKMVTLALDATLGFTAFPIRAISGVSLVLWGISLVYLVRSLVVHFVFHGTVQGWTSLICLLFFFTGLILFCMAIIGAYVGRIFVQGQGYPLYWLSGVRNVPMGRTDGDEPREYRLARSTVPADEGSDGNGVV
jgi:polyisoprenyl-phosphate glycosyltransferase